MKPKPTVTIGLCVKDVEQTVREAMDSIFRQDFPRDAIELIVVDGHSKDKTVEIIKDALSKHVQIKHKIFYENKGLGKARQIVVDNATGNYVIWVDGDMTLAEDHVRKQVEFMDRNPKVAIAGGRFKMLPQLNLVATLENLEWLVWDFESQNKTVTKPTRNYCGGTIHRVKAVKEAGGFDTSIKGSGEDLDLEYRISEIGWLLHFTTTASFHDRRKQTWPDVWHENFWYGYGAHHLLHKHQKSIPATNLLAGLQRAFTAYKLTHRKASFLLPVQYSFKKIAWFFGFTKAHVDEYGHS